jgi:hypothetical protein
MVVGQVPDLVMVVRVNELALVYQWKEIEEHH